MRRRLGRLLAAAAVFSTAACGPAAERAPERPGVGEEKPVAFAIEERGVSGRYPAGWYHRDAITNLAYPQEVVAIASYWPLPDGNGGECLSDEIVDAIPPDGALIWLFEYRPSRGEVWADLRRSDFPPRPRHFELRRGDLDAGLWCHDGPGFRANFVDAERPLDVSVLFGATPSDAQLREVGGILDGIRFEPLPPPPPDPYEGWREVHTNSGDGLRTPPGWPATAAMFPLATPRPRALFFASNRPLAGLPSKFVPRVDLLPGRFPDAALADFPSDGVLVWVLEEEPGGTTSGFPEIGRGWPEDALAEAAPPAGPPGLRWFRAGGSFAGFRFSVWLAHGATAGESDRKLALKSLRSLAVSACWRDRFDDCPEDD